MTVHCIGGVSLTFYVFQLTSLLDQLRHSASWLSEDTRLEFWRKCYMLLVEHDVTPTTAANFLQV